MLRTVKALLLPVSLGAAILYFSYHALAGEQGLSAWARLQENEVELEKRLAELQAEEAALEASVARLRDETLDPDYVEEIARTKLSYARPDELLVSTR
jgi:cell division protein FtsB